MWAKVFTYVPRVDLIRNVLPVSKLFRREAYWAMRDLDWIQEWGRIYDPSDEFLKNMVPPKALNFTQRCPNDFRSTSDLFCYDGDEIDRLVKQFPSVSKMRLPNIKETTNEKRTRQVAKMESLIEYHDQGPLYEMDDLLATLVKNENLRRLDLSTYRPHKDPRRIFKSVHLWTLSSLPHLSHLGINCEALDAESYQAWNHFPALTELTLRFLSEVTFSGMTQAMSEELGQRLTLAYLHGEFDEGTPTFLAKCPHLRDLTLVTRGEVISLSPLPQLKSFRCTSGHFERPLFECLSSKLETLEVRMGELRRHSEEQLKDGLRHLKSLTSDLIDPFLSEGTVSHQFVVEAVASITNLERLRFRPAFSDRVYESYAPILESLIFRSNWKCLKHLDLVETPISRKELDAICKRFSSLTHLVLSLSGVKKADLACLLKLKALEMLGLELLGCEGDEDIQQVFAIGNALFPLDPDGKDALWDKTRSL